MSMEMMVEMMMEMMVELNLTLMEEGFLCTLGWTHKNLQ